MASARAEILGRVRDALRDKPTAPPVPRDYVRSGEASVELLAERVAHYRATVHVVAEPDVVPLLGELLAGKRIVVPDGLAWDVPGMTALRDPLTVAELDAADGALTGCAVAIAQTGTIVLDGGPGQGRRALTLLPDHHVCVVRADQIAGTVPEALERLDPLRPLTFVSGPSATSDIELDRVEGVHGPRRLEVLIIR
ncbi:lactate utilization protein C [Saccharothrix sp.]|uniref:LutC/YkgG family protein n=1 Tax=Saccharothrix sp. TaxID=1873460 RepID=UPI0028128856|nr:lactate utilization protein C [Saccharothrix sp.]